MSAESLYEFLDIDYLIQPIISNYPGSRIYTQVNIDSNVNIHRSLGYSKDASTGNNTDSIFKRVFDICKTYGVSFNIHPTTVSDDICCVRVLKDKQALDYLIDLGEIAQQKMPMDEAFITRIDMAAKELSNNIHGFDLGSVSELTIKEENV